MTLVSIITPVFNALPFVSQTIDSVLNQTYQNWELILVDDGSTDGSYKKIEPYLTDSRIKYILQENQGQGKARNTGIKASKGDFIAFLDSDDLWVPEKLDLQISLLIEQDIDLVYSNAFIINSYGIRSDVVMKTGSLAGIQPESDLLQNLIRGNIFVPILTVMSKREAIISSLGFDESPDLKNAEDFDLWIRMASLGSKFFFDERCLSYYRIHENQSTARDPTSTGQVIYSLLNLRRNRPTLSKEIELSILARLIVLFRKSGFLTYKRESFYNSLCEIGASSRYLNKLVVYYFPITIPIFCRYISNRLRSTTNQVVEKSNSI
jgi:teichuronic acid biosynthesis glycosyltransferase TuaG